MGFTHTRADFPEDFLFGAATAAYQIEGSSFGGCGPSHWDTFAATPGNVANGDDGAVACDHYHRFAEDLDLVRVAGFDAYRFSTSWSRVLPEGRGRTNEAGLDYYERLVDEILSRGLRPFLTLYHWDLPAALSDLGGWRNRDVADWFADFTEIVIGRIGDRVAAVATLNEPWCVSWLSHFWGFHAPGLRDIRATAHSMHHVLLAHGRAVEVMRAMNQRNLGIVLNFEYANPATDTDADRAAADRYDGIYNRWFVEAMFSGRYPDIALEGLGSHMPKGFENDMETIGAPLDWLGVNYYTRSNLRHLPNAMWPTFEAVPGPLDKTDMGWEIYPDGLRNILTRLHRDYTRGLPIYVTENGMAGANETGPGTIDDAVRTDYFDAHLHAVRGAIKDGVPVKGYFAWSLLDNYEWSFGYGKRFGIVHVDYATQKRTPKASYQAFRQALSRS
ncbi:GH1 family beta-glucosidase [Oricola cellulosilytica]|uniref:Beta-glucosidase n=1 Tax=Oricola cellulosilytica TaxID=1429082 RepID=A0A4R0PC84_9HYPH|nr:GH1 family beta-glucosidase [Oricola cellulosilytica]TCD13778.1 beta-glucosidase [Oricola cellulosilytica]